VVTLTAALTFSDSETLSTASDVLILTADDEAATFQALGFEAKDAIILLSADQSDDNGDDWQIEADQSTNALIFSNDTSGAQVAKLSLSTAGVITLSDSETLTNSSDVVSLTADDEAADLTLVGFEAKDAQIVLKADQSDDNGDDWQIKAAQSGNAFTISNDTSGSQAAKLTLSTAGAMTSVVSITGAGTGSLSGYLQAQVASTTAALTAAQCGSTIVSNSADVQVLPEASTVLGCRYTFICGTTDDYDINPDDADIIGPVNSVDGGTGAAITPSAGDAIRCTDVGSSLTLEAIAADRWAAVGVGNGAWTDVN
jgi:hypothetical protein